MGGDQRQQFWDASNIQKQNLPYEGPMPSLNTASDDYTQRHFKKRDERNQKQIDALMDALARLGMLKEADPYAKDGIIPMIPYRELEQPRIGF